MWRQATHPSLTSEVRGQDSWRMSKGPGDALGMAEVSDIQAGQLKGKSVRIVKATLIVS